jgi:asparagine synthase (glutamine-hydrolysing)
MSQDYLACVAIGGAPRTLHPPLLSALAERGCVERPSKDALRLFVGPDLPVRGIAKGGWVLGHLFDRTGVPAAGELNLELSEDGIGRFTRNFWGSYLALSSTHTQARAARDPSGGIPCYFARLEERLFFTSMPQLLVDCGLIDAAIDWTEIARSLAHHSERASETAIRGISELLPGTATIFSTAEDRTWSIWDSWDHAAKAPVDASESLRQSLCMTLEAWGRSFRRPLIEISGGLDSAIVAAGISQSSPDAALITFAPAGGDPDETLYAKAIADHLGIDLTIVQPRVADVDLNRSLSADLPRPNARAFTQAADLLSLQYGRAIGADAFVSGGGGDDVFCYLRTVLPALDRLRSQGVRAMLDSAMDIAVMNHSTFWEALSRIVRRLVQHRPGKSSADLRFLSNDAAADRASPDLRGARELCPGKAEHVRGIASIHNHLEGHARAGFAPILSPLLSQPIVETCLSIPSWHWCEGGRNRAVARRAFEKRLPACVLDRRSKGYFDGFCFGLFDANRALVRSMLLDGELARQGLLDRGALEPALNISFPSAKTVARLLALVDVESWIESWRARIT